MSDEEERIKGIEVKWDHRFIISEALVKLGFNVEVWGHNMMMGEDGVPTFEKATIRVRPDPPIARKSVSVRLTDKGRAYLAKLEEKYGQTTINEANETWHDREPLL